MNKQLLVVDVLVVDVSFLEMNFVWSVTEEIAHKNDSVPTYCEILKQMLKISASSI